MFASLVPDEMKIFFVVVALCALSVRAAPSQVQETSPFITLKDYWALNKGLDTRIINGSPAAAGQFPWQCSNLFTVGGSSFVCGASLINPNAVLTAAHCVIGASQFQIGCGSLLLTNPDANRVTRLTTDGRYHPGYNSQTLNNDVGLVIFAQGITYTSLIQPIRLATAAETLGAGVSVRVSGWGRTSDASQAVSQTLNFVDVTTISNLQCALVYGFAAIIDSTVCAIGVGPAGNVGSTCGGDSGGPLVRQQSGAYVQQGVVSFVHIDGCGSGNPSGYVRTEAMRGWIESHVTLL